MKRSFLVPLASILLPLLAGCRAGDITETDLLRRDQLPPDVVLEVGVIPASISPGDTTHIRVTLRNLSEGIVTLDFSSDCQLVYLVEDASGTIVRPEDGAWPCADGLTTLTLHPNMFEREEFVWDGIAETGPLAPGDYRVYGALGKEMTVRSVSQPLTIQ